MTILVIGLGFVGLTAALGFADNGFQVYGYDIDCKHASKINKGEVPFFEKGLPDALKRNLGKSFHVIDSIDNLKIKPNAIFICVGTPCDENGKADLQYLMSGIDSIAGKISDACVLVVKSTVPPGTTDKEIIPYARTKGLVCPIVVNPEFLREGYCWLDFTKPDRIVCGVGENDLRVSDTLNEIYSPFQAPIHYVTPNTAEFIKYLSNSLLANLVSFSNEMAAVAEAVDRISVSDAFRILHEDSRLAGSGIAHYIYPGCGYGGSCLPKDTTALIQNAKGNGFDPKILQEVVRLNNTMPQLTAQKIIRKTKSVTDRIGILGLSFKPNSSDVRESSAARIISELLDKGYSDIHVYDPVANEDFKEYYGLPLKYYDTKDEVCDICSIVAVVTVWTEFKGIHRKYPDISWIDCRYSL